MIWFDLFDQAHFLGNLRSDNFAKIPRHPMVIQSNFEENAARRESLVSRGSGNNSNGFQMKVLGETVAFNLWVCFPTPLLKWG